MFSVLVIFIFVISPPRYVLERTLYQMQNRHILPNLIGSFFFFSANISTYHINIIFFLTDCLPYGHPIFRSCWSNSELKTGHSKTTFIIKKREASFNLWPWWVAWGNWRTDRTLTYPFYYTALTPFFVKLLLPSSSTKGSHPLKQARKSSEDAQATGYAQFEKVWVEKVWTQNTCILAAHFWKFFGQTSFSG